MNSFLTPLCSNCTFFPAVYPQAIVSCLLQGLTVLYRPASRLALYLFLYSYALIIYPSSNTTLTAVHPTELGGVPRARGAVYYRGGEGSNKHDGARDRKASPSSMCLPIHPGGVSSERRLYITREDEAGPSKTALGIGSPGRR